MRKSMQKKIPATVVTGFLGAGKTTVIQNLIEKAGNKKLALIINEFGELAVDGDLLRDCGNPNCTEDEIFELANGCICCTVADDFLPTIQKIINLEDKPDHIIIETSGLALPKPLVQAFGWPEVRTKITVDAVVTIIDGPAVFDGRFAHDPFKVHQQRKQDQGLDHESPLHELYEDQLACADLVLLNKVDLMTTHQLVEVEKEVGERLREGVRMVCTENGMVDIEMLLGIKAEAENDTAARASHHDSEEDHDHDDFESFDITFTHIANPDVLIDRLSTVTKQHKILRIKGFANVEGKSMRLVVQGVGTRIQAHYDRPWETDEEPVTKLVFIGEAGLDRLKIEEMVCSRELN